MISDLYDQYEDLSKDVNIVARRVLNAILRLSPQELRALIQPVITNAVIDLRRHAVRAIEQDTEAVEFDSLASRREILQISFWSPIRKRYVLWGEGTVQDHLAYAELLRKQIEGMLRTIALHEEAAAEITAAGAGVTCLFDIRRRNQGKAS